MFYLCVGFLKSTESLFISVNIMAHTSLSPEVRSKPILKQEIAFAIVHLLPLGALLTGATLFDWIVCAVLYFTRMFWVTGGYRRYFAHKS